VSGLAGHTQKSLARDRFVVPDQGLRGLGVAGMTTSRLSAGAARPVSLARRVSMPRLAWEAAAGRAADRASSVPALRPAQRAGAAQVVVTAAASRLLMRPASLLMRAASRLLRAWPRVRELPDVPA